MSSHDAEVSFSSTVGGEGGGGGGRGGGGVAARVKGKCRPPANLAGPCIFHEKCTMTAMRLLVNLSKSTFDCISRGFSQTSPGIPEELPSNFVVPKKPMSSCAAEVQFSASFEECKHNFFPRIPENMGLRPGQKHDFLNSDPAARRYFYFWMGAMEGSSSKPSKTPPDCPQRWREGV